MGKETEIITIPKGIHAAEHQTGGVDEINITGLAGLVADAQNPLNHHANHESGGGDEVDATNLAGVKRIATGSYTGDAAAFPRQITVGFQCSMVVILTTDGGGANPDELHITIPNMAIDVETGNIQDDTASLALHAADGFNVGGASTNNNLSTYYYWAISVN